MWNRVISVALLSVGLSWPVIIDRIAIIVGNSIVKDSDIDRDLRVTSFLNNVALDLSPVARKKAANRLIDQIFIRHEIEIGDYPTATLQDADRRVGSLKKERFRTDAAYQEKLRSYGITELELRTQFQWQLTVLRFVDIRFRSGVLVTDEEIAKYYRDHAETLGRQNPGKSSLSNLQEKIRETLQAEGTNQQFFAWLDDQRKQTKIQYREENLA